MTPGITMVTQATPEVKREVWKVRTNGSRLMLRSGTGTKYKIIGKYKNGTEVVLLEKTTSSWYRMLAPDGKQGYMSIDWLQYVRTEVTSGQGEAVNEVVEPRQLRDQPFRIYRVVPELDRITVYARHVFYDLMDNMIRKYEPSATTTGANVAQGLASGVFLSTTSPSIPTSTAPLKKYSLKTSILWTPFSATADSSRSTVASWHGTGLMCSSSSAWAVIPTCRSGRERTCWASPMT